MSFNLRVIPQVVKELAIGANRCQSLPIAVSQRSINKDVDLTPSRERLTLV